MYRKVYSSLIFDNQTLVITQMSFNSGMDSEWWCVPCSGMQCCSKSEWYTYQTWMNLKNILLSERGWTYMNSCSMVPCVQRSKQAKPIYGLKSSGYL